MKNLFNNNVFRLFSKLLPVQIFLSITSGLSGIINGLIIGNFLSASAMRALGLVVPMINFLSGLASIVSGGSAIVCGKFMGTGETKKIDNVFSSAMITLVAVGLLLTGVTFVLAKPLAVLLGASGESLIETSNYIRSLSVGITPLISLSTLMVFLQMNNKSTLSLFATIILAVFNAIFGLINVSVVKGGIIGVGLASSLSNFLTMLLIVIYFIIKKDLVHFNFRLFDFSMVKELLFYGFPASLAGILYSIRNVFINKYAFITAGNDAVNALAILGSCGIFFDCFNIGVASTLAMLASVFIGERDSRNLMILIRTTLVYSLIFTILKFVLGYGLGDKIAILFGAQENIVPLAYQLLYYYSWSTPFNFIVLILISIYQSLGRIKFCSIIYLFNCIITPFICCAFLSKIFGIRAIWACYTIAEIVSITIMYVIASIKKKAPATSFEDMLYLDHDFDTDNKISISIDSIDEVTNIAREVEQFCKDHGIDKKRSMLSGLCMEEMAGNVVEHGFHKDNKQHTLDIFACVENDEVTLRLRDNCVPFDPKTKLAQYTDDPIKNIGIKMVSKLAKEMNYQTTFGMNVLTIKV